MNHSLPTVRRLNLHYIMMQAGFWAMFAGICAYQAALLYGRGFSNSQVGVIIAVRCSAGILLQPMLGGFADRHPEVPLKVIVALSLGLSFCAGLVFLALPGMGLGGTLVIFFLVGGFEISAYPLMDAMAIQYINDGVPIQYSLGRGVGSMAYALCSLLMGLLVARAGVESTLLLHAGLVILELLLVLTFPTFRGKSFEDGAERPKPQSAWMLLRRNPRFALMLLAILFTITAFVPLSNFLVNIITDRGGATADLSLGLFIMAAFELPTTFFFLRLLNRFGSGRLLLVSMVFIALKALALLLAPSLLWVYLAQPLQMLGYGLFTPASVFFVNESVPEADRVRGQTIMMVASNGMGGVFGNLLGGRVLDLGFALGGNGVNWMLTACLSLAVVGILLGILALKSGKTEREAQ